MKGYFRRAESRAIFYAGIGVERGTHRRLIFLCSGATAERFTRQICDHKMSGTKSNMLHRKTSEIIIGTFMGSTGAKGAAQCNSARSFHCEYLPGSIYRDINRDILSPFVTS